MGKDIFKWIFGNIAWDFIAGWIGAHPYLTIGTPLLGLLSAGTIWFIGAPLVTSVLAFLIVTATTLVIMMRSVPWERRIEILKEGQSQRKGEHQPQLDGLIISVAGQMDGTVYENIISQDDREGFIYIDLEITNSGAPTAITGWVVAFKNPNGEHAFHALILKDSERVDRAQSGNPPPITANLVNDDRVIECGGKRLGWLKCLASSRQFYIWMMAPRVGMKLEVKFKDVFKNDYTINWP